MLGHTRNGHMANKDIHIAIIGGGPKAVAIAAKAASLSVLYSPAVKVTIFERTEIGAHWTGTHGYTTGDVELCTLAERDLGFPYHSTFGPRCSADLYHRYSWAAFAIEQGFYANWIDEGRRPPSHKAFSAYLKWAAVRSKARTVIMNVTQLTPHRTKWTVHGRQNGQKVTHPRRFDGVVITSPGDAIHALPITGDAPRKRHPRIFNGVDFWSRLGHVQELLEEMRQQSVRYQRRRKVMPEANRRVVIVGGGGTGAATLAWLAQHAPDFVKLALVANQAILHGRHDNPFENRVFSDPELWGKISKANQKKFYERLTRGIVWNNVIEQIKRADVSPYDGYAKSLSSKDKTVSVIYERDGQQYEIEGAIVIDATGFDRWWFQRLLPEAKEGLRKTHGLDLTDPKTQGDMESKVSESLDFHPDQWPYPPFQVPNLASAAGPSYGSLMTLGMLSDHVIGHYLDPESIRRADNTKS